MATTEDGSKGGNTPKISQFVLYAERSIALGSHSCADGDVGVRSAFVWNAPPAQMTLAEHARARSVYAPSVALSIYAEAQGIFTSSLQRVLDVGVGAEQPFPAAMPLLPLALAQGQGRDVLVGRFGQLSLGPGTYGAVTLLYESELWLAAGTYVFASLLMDEGSKLIGLPGEVQLGIVGRMSVAARAHVHAHSHRPSASEFQISLLAMMGLRATSRPTNRPRPPRRPRPRSGKRPSCTRCSPRRMER